MISRRTFIASLPLLSIASASGETPNLGVCCGGSYKEQCRYLSQDDDDSYHCLKLAEERSIIDEEVADFLASGLALSLPLGDNCPGKNF